MTWFSLCFVFHLRKKMIITRKEANTWKLYISIQTVFASSSSIFHTQKEKSESIFSDTLLLPSLYTRFPFHSQRFVASSSIFVIIFMLEMFLIISWSSSLMIFLDEEEEEVDKGKEEERVTWLSQKECMYFILNTLSTWLLLLFLLLPREKERERDSQKSTKRDHRPTKGGHHLIPPTLWSKTVVVFVCETTFHFVVIKARFLLDFLFPDFFSHFFCRLEEKRRANVWRETSSKRIVHISLLITLVK